MSVKKEKMEIPEIRVTLDLSVWEHRLVVNALKLWRGDFGQVLPVVTMWNDELTELLNRIDFKPRP